MEIVDVEENLNSELKRDFRGQKDGFVQVGEKKWFYPKKYQELADEYKNFEVRPDDIWITGYPRSAMFGPYFEHVKQGFERIGSKNFIFTFYEELSKDNRTHIRKLSEFLEIYITEENITKLEEYIHIDNFREVRKSRVKDKNNSPVIFIRKGNVGGWREYFSQDMNDEAEPWIEMNTRRIGFKYPQQV